MRINYFTNNGSSLLVSMSSHRLKNGTSIGNVRDTRREFNSMSIHIGASGEGAVGDISRKGHIEGA